MGDLASLNVIVNICVVLGLLQAMLMYQLSIIGTIDFPDLLMRRQSLGDLQYLTLWLNMMKL